MAAVIGFGTKRALKASAPASDVPIAMTVAQRRQDRLRGEQVYKRQEDGNADDKPLHEKAFGN